MNLDHDLLGFVFSAPDNAPDNTNIQRKAKSCKADAEIGK